MHENGTVEDNRQSWQGNGTLNCCPAISASDMEMLDKLDTWLAGGVQVCAECVCAAQGALQTRLPGKHSASTC